MNPKFDPILVANAINYHGHYLLKTLVDTKVEHIKTIQLPPVDFKAYKNREDQKIQEDKPIVNFLCSKCDLFLVEHEKLSTNEDHTYKDRYKHQLPLEYFFSIQKKLRVERFMNFVKRGDIIIATVQFYMERKVHMLRFLSFDYGPHRYLSDVTVNDIKMVLQDTDTVVSSPDDNSVGMWLLGTRLRVEVLKTHDSLVIVGTLGVTIPEDKKDKIKLGKVFIKDVPEVFSFTYPNTHYLSQCLSNMQEYSNPKSIKHLAQNFGLDVKQHFSFMNNLKCGINPNHDCKVLRKTQLTKWAHKSVADGVTHFKAGRHEEAFQCLNKALHIDPESVEAFVAKGALLANLGHYEKAVEDFERALELKPNHPNAKNYMCETLVELGKQYEISENLTEAEKCYFKCLQMNPSHAGANAEMQMIRRKLAPPIPVMQEKKDDYKEEVENFLSELFKTEDEMKRKSNVKEAKHDSTMDSKPMSPLSLKMSMQENCWLPPSDKREPFMMGSSPPGKPTGIKIKSEEENTKSVLKGQDGNNSGLSLTSQKPIRNDLFNDSPKDNSTEESKYKEEVEKFLKQLASGPSKKKKSQKRSKLSKTERRNKKKKKRRYSSSSSTSSSSSSEEERKSKKKAKKKRKKEEEREELEERKDIKCVDEETPIPAVPSMDFGAEVPSLEDLEKKLQDYYKRMESMRSKPGESEKTANNDELLAPMKMPTEPVKPMPSALPKSVHPAFAANSSSDEEDKKKKNKSNFGIFKPVITSVVAKAAAEKAKAITINLGKRKSMESIETVKNEYKSASPKSRSRSRSRSYSQHRRRSRTYSRSRSRSRSLRRYRSRSRSYDHRRYRSRSRSRPRDDYYGRRRSSRSYSRSPRYRMRSKSRSYDRYIPHRYHHRPRFHRGYNSYRGRQPLPHHHDSRHNFAHYPKYRSRARSPSRSRSRTPSRSRYQTRSRTRSRERSTCSRDNSDNSMEDQSSGAKAENSPDRAARFGKWDNLEDESNEEGKAARKSLDEMENFLQREKEKKLQKIRERNSKFLKPNN